METQASIERPGRHVLPVLAIGSVLALTVIRIALANKTELLPEEAYYWTYSRHPALSYFDHPPMVAWIIALGTALFGNTELGVRFSTIALWPGSALLLFLTGRLWFGNKAAELAVILFCLCPVFVGIGFIVTPDSPLVFFWLWTLYSITKAVQTGQSGFWVLAGIGLGCAMLSKYTAVMLTGSLLVFLLFSTNYRHWLLRIQPWLALLLSILVFSPVLIWNEQHQWTSFVFQSTRTEVGNNDPKIVELSTFWMYQLVALTPILFGFYVYTLIPAVRRGWVCREDRWNFAISFSLPLFFIFVLAGFKTKGHINWTTPCYLSWSFAAAAVLLETDKTWKALRPTAWKWLKLITIILCVAVNIVVHTGLTWGFPKKFALKNAGGWRGLAHEVGIARDGLGKRTGQPAFILGADKYGLAAELGFYTGDTADTVNDYSLGTYGLGYRYWSDFGKLQGRPAIAVLEQDKFGPFSVSQLRQHFKTVGELKPVQINGNFLQKRLVYLVECEGYLGR